MDVAFPPLPRIAWGETECARTFSGKRLPWADREAERVYALIGQLWDVWYVVHGDDCCKASWQAKPIGASTSVVSAATPDELVSAVIAYVDQLPDHIEATRQKLRDADETWIGYVAMLNSRLTALLQVQKAQQMT